jgi:hypothetical protein
MNPRINWFAGLVLGAWTGFCLVYFAIVGAVLFVGFAIGASIGRSREALGGLRVGAGTVILVMLALANANCDGGCTPPDLTGWLVTGYVMTTAGLLRTAVLVIGSLRLARTSRP